MPDGAIHYKLYLLKLTMVVDNMYVLLVWPTNWIPAISFKKINDVAPSAECDYN